MVHLRVVWYSLPCAYSTIMESYMALPKEMNNIPYVTNLGIICRAERRVKRLISRIEKEKWGSMRKKVIDNYGAVCMKCGSTGKINVDHIRPKCRYPSLKFKFENLQVLCWPCNASKNYTREDDYRPQPAREKWSVFPAKDEP